MKKKKKMSIKSFTNFYSAHNAVIDKTAQKYFNVNHLQNRKKSINIYSF